MTTRRFRVLTLDRALIYGGFSALAVVAVAWAIARALVLGEPIATGFLVSGPVTAVAFVLISARLFWLRLQWQLSINFYTGAGVAVLANHAASWLGPEHRIDLEFAINRTIDFWCARYPHRRERIREYVSGSSLSFTTEVIVYHAKGDPGAGWQRRLAVGLTSGQHVAVRFPDRESWPGVIALVHHEMSHVALNACGFVDMDGETHHRIMREAKAPW